MRVLSVLNAREESASWKYFDLNGHYNVDCKRYSYVFKSFFKSRNNISRDFEHYRCLIFVYKKQITMPVFWWLFDWWSARDKSDQNDSSGHVMELEPPLQYNNNAKDKKLYDCAPTLLVRVYNTPYSRYERYPVSAAAAVVWEPMLLCVCPNFY
jgi:hypothetical protein